MDLKEVLHNTRVSELTLTGRPSLHPTQTVAAAAAEMRKTSHGSAVVCEDDRLVGIFTERDLMRVLATGQGLDQVLRDVMTANPQTLGIDDRLIDAITAMDAGGYRRIPVVDAAHRPVGILDVKSVVHFLVELFPKTIYNQAAHAQLIARHREGA